MSFKKFVILLFVLLLASFTAFADGHSDNACLEGGSLEGECNSDLNNDGVVTDFEVDFMWTCGWYIARYEVGSSGLPDWCVPLVDELRDVWCQVKIYDGWYGWEWDLGPGYDVWYSDSDHEIFDQSWAFNHFQREDPGYPACGF